MLILFKEKVFPEVLSVASDIASKLHFRVKVFASDIPPEELEKSLPQGENFELIRERGDFGDILEREEPFLTLLPRPKVAPLLHAFRKPWSERLVESTDRWNFLLVQQGTARIERALLYVDRDTASDDYIRTAYEFLVAWGVEVNFTTVFDERYYELLIKKEHPEMEAKEILGRMFEEYIEGVRNRIKEALRLERVEIIPLRGVAGKALPFFAKKHRYDLLVISHAYEDKEKLIENSETSVAVFTN